MIVQGYFHQNKTTSPDDGQCPKNKPVNQVFVHSAKLTLINEKGFPFILKIYYI